MAAVAVMVNVLIVMSYETLFQENSMIPDWKASLIAIISTVLIFGFKKVNSMWIVIGGALLGYLFMLF